MAAAAADRLRVDAVRLCARGADLAGIGNGHAGRRLAGPAIAALPTIAALGHIPSEDAIEHRHIPLVVNRPTITRLP